MKTSKPKLPFNFLRRVDTHLKYFQHYYLQPRALASAYQRLSPYYGPWGYYRYGPSPGFGFRHYGYGRFRY